MTAPVDILVGAAFILAGLAIVVRHFATRTPDLIGRNEAMRRILRKSDT